LLTDYLCKRSVDESKLKAHFEELKTLVAQLAQLPEIKQIPELAKQLAALNKESPSAVGIKMTVPLLPEIIRQLLPLMPNIELECDLEKITENFLSLLEKIV
jgi:hypothetical protein